MARSDPGAWIIGRRADLFWFWGSAGLSLAAGAAAMTWPVLALPIFCAWLLLGDGPHFWSTWTRSYWDPMERGRRGAVLWRSLWIFAPGFLCWGLWRATGVMAPWTGFLLVAALWGYHHAVRQDYGLWSLYARRAAVTAAERKVDAGFLYGLLWGIFAWFSVAHPLNASELGRPLPGWVAPGLLGAWAVGAMIYGSIILYRIINKRPVLPALFVLLPCVGLYAVGFLWIGLREPVIAGATNLEQAFAVLAVANGLQHGLQYLGLVHFAAGNRYPSGGPSLGERLSAHPARAWLFYVALSLPYVALNLSRGAAPGVHPASATLIGLSLCLYWGFVLHHYYLDQHLWRPHQDPALRHDLRLS